MDPFRDLFTKLFKRETKAPALQVGVDLLMTKLSVMDEVVSARVNDDGTITVYVKVNVEQALPKILGCVRTFAPGTHGEVRRSVRQTLPMMPAISAAAAVH